MIARSRWSTRCAGAIGPRPAGWSWLRNAWDSYHFATHSVNSLDFSRGIADVQPMPRTPLLRALRRLADEHRAAEQLGIPPAELRGQQAEIAALTRGDLLKKERQFKSRYWNSLGSNGNVYSDNGFQNSWDTAAGETGASGLLVDYAGGNSAASFKPSTPYSTTADNSQVTTYAKAWLKQLEAV